MPFLFLSPPLLLITLLGAALMGWAQWRVSSAYGRWSKVRSRRGLSGAAAARMLLDADRLFDVAIERTKGRLDDHYDPRERVLRLSPAVYDGTSLASLGVAAHEAGHALQHAEGYAPLSFRQAFFPVAAFASRVWTTLFILGIVLAASAMGKVFLVASIVALSLYTLFTLVTLPVEFDASRRALVLLEGSGVLQQDEVEGARRVLSAAGLTYAASAFTSVMTLLYLLLRVREE